MSLPKKLKNTLGVAALTRKLVWLCGLAVHYSVTCLGSLGREAGATPSQLQPALKALPSLLVFKTYFLYKDLLGESSTLHRILSLYLPMPGSQGSSAVASWTLTIRSKGQSS